MSSSFLDVLNSLSVAFLCNLTLVIIFGNFNIHVNDPRVSKPWPFRSFYVRRPFPPLDTHHHITLTHFGGKWQSQTPTSQHLKTTRLIFLSWETLAAGEVQVFSTGLKSRHKEQPLSEICWDCGKTTTKQEWGGVMAEPYDES